MLYVIRRKKDGALVTGTDYRYYPHHQILKYPTKPPLIISDYDGELPFPYPAFLSCATPHPPYTTYARARRVILGYPPRYLSPLIFL